MIYFIYLAYIVMELGGENLAKLIQRLHSMQDRGGRPGTYINPTIRKEVWRQMVSIVNTLTANNIVHLDLKPDNLILFGRTLKIADLGISKKADMIG
jgi:serine/threonine protein kinase